MRGSSWTRCLVLVGCNTQMASNRSVVSDRGNHAGGKRLLHVQIEAFDVSVPEIRVDGTDPDGRGFRRCIQRRVRNGRSIVRDCGAEGGIGVQSAHYV